jgi:glycosyltransferase involved in cell wall biosynthesis
VRVLFISDVYFPRVNGVSTSVRTFRHDLAACDVETVLVAPDYGLFDTEPEEGVVRVAATGVVGDPEDRRMRWGALTRALENLASDDFNLVHIHTPFVAHYAGVRAARRLKIPCVATYHTFFEEYLHHYIPVLPRALGRTLARRFTRSQCRDVAALIAPSEPMRDVLLEYGVTTPIHIVPTGLAAHRFQPGNGARFRAAHDLPADRPLMLYIGRVAHEKNIDFLVRVFAQVRSSVPNALFVIAGEGPARESLRQLVASLGFAQHVHFVGYLDRDTALLDCYAAADVFVFASRTETQGLVLLEAMAQGAPVVSTAKLGTRSILKEESGALIVDEEVDAFAATTARVLTDRQLRATLARQGRTYAREWASLAMARRLTELYRSVTPIAATSCAARLNSIPVEPALTNSPS